ncbi:Gfo/Idh/MocA family protein [Phytoactinopolyspora halotolerans]|uniref:Gfo/Idh/MocA family oxidoreductase n=1 Tax=Phytoactinopolyspora halotolerans TaxID=1981512 RepID=A0A6L9S8T4_9ACTN|nr:Gfo/Idh/MocA family oxidoreductase [Phytoactinopolyspora halotolerans]NEE01014.1 Gfo/Idh/MocA family oxidoreductase [Phytoactinopolyspora halotolerans]
MSESTTTDLRVGVLGLGNRGRLARHAHRPGDGARVVAAADPNPATFSAARNWFGQELTTVADHRDLLHAGLDAVMILTPDHTHEELAVRFLEAGIAVYLEKPMAITVDGCDRILQTARRHGTRLYVGHNMRHMPVVLLMRELIQNGEIGEVTAVWCRHFVGHGGDFYFKDWHAEQRYSTSLLLQKGAHDIDVIHWLAGGYTSRLTAMGALTLYGRISDRHDNTGLAAADLRRLDRWPPLAQTGLNPTIDVEDLEMVTMALDNGVFATYQQCQYTPDYWRNYTVIGTEGRLENFGDTQPGAVVRVWNSRTGFKPGGDKEIPVPVPVPGTARDGHGGADAAILDEFLGFVRHGGTTNTSPVAARHSVATGVLAARSLRSGAVPLDVPPLPPDLVSYFDDGQPARP